MATNFSRVLSNTVRPDWTLKVVQPEAETAVDDPALAELDEGQLVPPASPAVAKLLT